MGGNVVMLEAYSDAPLPAGTSPAEEVWRGRGASPRRTWRSSRAASTSASASPTRRAPSCAPTRRSSISALSSTSPTRRSLGLMLLMLRVQLVYAKNTTVDSAALNISVPVCVFLWITCDGNFISFIWKEHQCSCIYEIRCYILHKCFYICGPNVMFESNI